MRRPVNIDSLVRNWGLVRANGAGKERVQHSLSRRLSRLSGMLRDRNRRRLYHTTRESVSFGFCEALREGSRYPAVLTAYFSWVSGV